MRGAVAASQGRDLFVLGRAPLSVSLLMHIVYIVSLGPSVGTFFQATITKRASTGAPAMLTGVLVRMREISVTFSESGSFDMATQRKAHG